MHTLSMTGAFPSRILTCCHLPPPITAETSRAPPTLKIPTLYSPEKIEVFTSLENWATQNLLSILKPVHLSWQPQDFLPNSSQSYDQFQGELRSLRDQTLGLSDDYFVVLVGDMITEEALPTYQTSFNRPNAVKDRTGFSENPWAVWSRGWTAEENRHGDLLRMFLYLSGRVDMTMVDKTIQYLIGSGMDGREVIKKNAFVPPPRLMNSEEARELHIRVERRRDPASGDHFENIDGMMFREGFLYKNVSVKSIRSHNISPTFDELEKFRTPSENGDGDVAGLSTLFANRKKGHFMKGDAVIVIKGDLKNLKGWVEKVEESNVHIRPDMKGLPKTLAVNEKELCKYFEPGNQVKVVSGKQQGATGMVVKVEGHRIIIISDTTKDHIHVFSDDVAESSEVTSGVTKIGDYELHDLVQLE